VTGLLFVLKLVNVQILNPNNPSRHTQRIRIH